MYSIETLTHLFSSVRQSVIGSDGDTIVFVNPSAAIIFGDNLIGSPAKNFFPQELLSEASDNIVCAAQVCDRDVIITRGSFDTLHIYYIDTVNLERSALKITRHMMSNLRNSAMGIKMSADRCFTLLDQGIAPTDKHVSIMYHYFHCLARSLSQVDTADLLERGELEFSPTAVNLIDLCAELTLSVESLSDELGINISFSTPESQVIAVVDPSKIQDLLINLFSNSIKNCKSGDSITLSLKLNESKIIFSIYDTGAGIPSGRLASVPSLPEDDYSFFDTKSGIGLGLYIAYGITSLHSGVMLIESRENEGTHIRVVLPADKNPAPKFSTPDLPYTHSGANAALTGLSDVLPSTGFGWKFEN